MPGQAVLRIITFPRARVFAYIDIWRKGLCSHVQRWRDRLLSSGEQRLPITRYTPFALRFLPGEPDVEFTTQRRRPGGQSGRRGMLRLMQAECENIASVAKTARTDRRLCQSHSLRTACTLPFVIPFDADGQCGRKQGEQLLRMAKRRQVGMGGYRHGKYPTISAARRRAGEDTVHTAAQGDNRAQHQE